MTLLTLPFIHQLPTVGVDKIYDNNQSAKTWANNYRKSPSQVSIAILEMQCQKRQ
jgi:hypothetical protein